MRRIKLVLAMATVLVGMLALQAGPAMAYDDCDFRERGNRDDVIVCNDDGEREVFDADDYAYFDDDYYDRYYENDFYFFTPYNYFYSPYNFYGRCEGPVCLID
jgi:hypothetical protein